MALSFFKKRRNITEPNKPAESYVQKINDEVTTIDNSSVKAQCDNLSTSTKSRYETAIEYESTVYDVTKSQSTVIYLFDDNENTSDPCSFETEHSDKVKSTSSRGSNITADFQVEHFQDSPPFSVETLHENSEDQNADFDTTKRSVVKIDLDVKRRKMSVCDNSIGDSRVPCLKTDAIDQLSHVIVQPPNYKLVKRQISVNRSDSREESKKPRIDKLETDGKACLVRCSDVNGYTSKCDVMNRTSDGNDNLKSKKGDSAKSTLRGELQKRHEVKSPIHTKTTLPSKTRRDISNSAPLQRKKTNSLDYLSNNHLDGEAFSKIPHHKIIAGTCFAVDAFSYGEIKNVKHYFLTHFHADHYAGLKKSFNKTLLCSKITADLCVSRLSVNMRHIQILVNDETVRIDGTEVTAVEANHCPGAIMLVFTLPNGKTILHTGDFRASYTMESYPIFWNKDIYTVYLDTTYCNPRYDFPSQDESIDMAFNILKEKKKAVEELGRNFNTVLIVCGTYTIGKEKFFMGVARRIGCTVWACSGKDSILQTVEDRSFNQVSALNCQLHVMPMRDITHEKLRNHLDTLKGTFTEVVAFKPSGWENTKKPSVEKDLVTIHGIPYSEHSSFSELVRFVKFLKPRQVVPTVDIPGGIKSVQKHFPCPLMLKEDTNLSQSKLSDFFKDKQGKPQI